MKKAKKSKLKNYFSSEKYYLKLVIETIPDALLLKDGEGRWMITNEAAKRLFKLNDIAWEGKTDQDLADLRPGFRAIHEVCLADDEKAWQARQMLVVEESMVREDGQLATFETRRMPLFTEYGQRAGLVVICHDINERKAREEQIQRMVFYDPLTGLPNRRFLETQMEQAMARAARNKRLLAVCMLDLDNFKPVNDSYGHKSGDEVLVTLGKRLPEVLRKSDFVARLGGDEFVLLVEDLADLDDLTKILTKVENTIATPIRLSNGETIELGASMGIFLYPLGNEERRDHVLRFADRALYESKAHKAERERSWMFFGEEREIFRTSTQQLLDAGGLEVWYQPILDIRARRVVGIEALARLRDKDGRILYPGEFLPQLAAEDLTDLSRLVLTQALADLAILDARGWSLWVSFNVTPESFCGQCVPCLQGVIAGSGIDPSRITLEILESSDFLERDSALSVLHEIKALGIRLALDDVGSAYASLMRLKDLPVDEIKLDQCFVRALEARPRDLHFVRIIQDLAMELKVDMVVEGVETADILDALMTTGATYLQGYAISRPIPFAQLQVFLAGYSCPDHDLPKSLFGFYAGTLNSHSAIKKMLMINPSETNSETLGNAKNCRGYGVLHRLGYGDDSHLQRLHDDYHRALGAAAENFTQSFQNPTWNEVETSLEVFLEAIMSERRKRREST